ncbi:MAG: 50S ribosomal protein L6 [Nitrospirota bacterium]|nr:50S ribosomal protein L6 [Nitrospirota bacterium]
MSRIGKKPIEIPASVDIKVDGNSVKAKGPKGELEWNFPAGTKVTIKESAVVVERLDDIKKTRALHGLTRNLIANMIEGVSTGYQKILQIVGVGYRAQVQGDKVLFTLGYSHPVEFQLPDGISAAVDQKQTLLTLAGIDKQKLGQVAANIRKLRKPDVYKGKGIRYANERLRLKAGKAGKK